MSFVLLDEFMAASVNLQAHGAYSLHCFTVIYEVLLIILSQLPFLCFLFVSAVNMSVL